MIPCDDSAVILLDEVELCTACSGLDALRVRELSAFAAERGEPLLRVMRERGSIEETELLEKLAERLGIPFTASGPADIPKPIRESIPASLAVEQGVMPVGERNGRLQVACSDPFGWERWDELQQIIGRQLEKVLCPSTSITRLQKLSYGIGAETVERLLSNRLSATEIEGLPEGTELGEEKAANEPTVVNLVNRIITEAIRANATDIHFEPFEKRYRVRFRIDGVLEDVSLPVSVNLLKLALVSRVKIMSNLDISEKRLPQDGRCQVSMGAEDFDLRVSLLPGVHGEAVNIRLQSRQVARLDLRALGYEQQETDAIARLIERPHGLVLITGPTGSGKTTTLYALLDKINRGETKIITIEDPVEYRMENILQMQVHEEIGFSFARALRSMLRHDPDVMLIGEIRDKDTAEIAVRSALTGHLVFATLHTNDAASAATRLLEVGIEPYLIASSLLGVVAQRLVRRVCSLCAAPAPLEGLSVSERELLTGWGAHLSDGLRRGRGCERCRFTGFRGRLAVAEVLSVSPVVRGHIQQRMPSEVLKDAARREGMRTLRESALVAVQSGQTTVDEVIRATQEDTL
jgi:general secretion pathway protein E/type IV pilus assembly protein PilB